MNIMDMTVKVVGRENEGNINKDKFIYGNWKGEEEKKEFIQYLRLMYYAQIKHEELQKLESKEGDSKIVKAVIAGVTDNENILRDARDEYLYFFKAKHGKLPSFRKS